MNDFISCMSFATMMHYLINNIRMYERILFYCCLIKWWCNSRWLHTWKETMKGNISYHVWEYGLWSIYIYIYRGHVEVDVTAYFWRSSTFNKLWIFRKWILNFDIFQNKKKCSRTWCRLQNNGWHYHLCFVLHYNILTACRPHHPQIANKNV